MAHIPTDPTKHIVLLTTDYFSCTTGLIVKAMIDYDLSKFNSWEELRATAHKDFVYAAVMDDILIASTYHERLLQELKEEEEDCIVVEEVFSDRFSIDGNLIDFNHIAPEVFEIIHGK